MLACPRKRFDHLHSNTIIHIRINPPVAVADNRERNWKDVNKIMRFKKAESSGIRLWFKHIFCKQLIK